jgi:hypothetical protein
VSLCGELTISECEVALKTDLMLLIRQRKRNRMDGRKLMGSLDMHCCFDILGHLSTLGEKMMFIP